MDLDLGYTPQPKQNELHSSPANEILYGGAAGPGKSHALRMEGLIWALRIPYLQVYLFRRTYPELEKNHIIPSLEIFPKGVGTYKDQKRRWEIPNGSMLHFSHCQYENDVFNYQGAEIHLLLIDELTTFTEFIYDYLRARVRCTLDIPEEYKHKVPGIIAASNPGGVGHEFCKRRWVEFTKRGDIKYRRAPGREGGMVRQYIPGKLEDNPILVERDPQYIHRLDALPEPFRTAYKDGDWDIFMGQAFSFNRYDHVIKPIPIPEEAYIYMTFDWGYGAPFSVGWWWVDSDNRVYRFAEWYGWNGTPNQGVRIVDTDIAQGILDREKEMGVSPQIRLAGPDCWNKKPDYKGGGQGPSTADEFALMGVYLTKGDPDRTLKIRQFRQRLNKKEDEMPMMMIYDTCEHFIRTIPLMQVAENNVEDIDTNLEDHCYDEACHICMARPISLEIPQAKKSELDKRLEDLKKGIPTTETDTVHFEEEALRENALALSSIGVSFDDVDTGDLYSTGL